jgi:hypothetical protein
MLTIFVLYEGEIDNRNLQNSIKFIEKTSNEAKEERQILLEKNNDLQQLVINLRSENAKLSDHLNNSQIEAKSERSQLKSQIDSLQAKLDPFIHFAKSKYPDLNVDQALDNLLKEVESLKEQTENLKKADKQIATQGIYRPLNKTIKDLLTSSLKEINDKYGGEISVEFSSEMGSQGRMLVSKELTELFKIAGYKTTGPNMTMSVYTGSKVPPKVQITFHPESQPIAIELFDILKIFLKSNFDGIKDKNRSLNNMKISIYGDPIFLPNGTLYLK